MSGSDLRLPVHVGAAIIAGCLALGACHSGSSGGAAGGDEAQPPAAKSADAKSAEGEGVTLTPEQIEKLGVVTETAKPIEHAAQVLGYGVVLSHDTIAQGTAELISAQATVRQSRSALARARKLDGTPGAVSADVEDAAAQKAAVDAAALTLTADRLSSTLGMSPPWSDPGNSSTLRELASGQIKLLRATFPLGTLSGRPDTLRAERIAPASAAAGWKLHVIWDAPADPNIPGRSYFAMLEGSDAGEGERLRVWAPIGKTEQGVLIPAAASVLRDGKYWCYIEKAPGTFVRVEIDTSKPLDEGYFVTQGVAVGDKVARTAVGQLLATEMGGGAEPD